MHFSVSFNKLILIQLNALLNGTKDKWKSMGDILCRIGSFRAYKWYFNRFPFNVIIRNWSRMLANGTAYGNLRLIHTKCVFFTVLSSLPPTYCQSSKKTLKWRRNAVSSSKSIQIQLRETDFFLFFFFLSFNLSFLGDLMINSKD